MKKLSSYQKLKARIKKLEQEKRTLVLKPDSLEAVEIQLEVAINSEMANAIMFGSRNGFGNGILDAVTSNKEYKKELTVADIEKVFSEIKSENLRVEHPPIKTGKKLIDIFNSMTSKTTVPDDHKFTSLFGIPVEEISWYPAEFFSCGDKACWIKEDRIDVITIPEHSYNIPVGMPMLDRALPDIKS